METGNSKAEGKGNQEPAARRPTIDHVTLRVRDLPASRRFYEAALAPLSLCLEFEYESLLAFGSGQSGRLIIYASERPLAGFHVAFSAPSREAVDRFHTAALEAGGRDNGAPGMSQPRKILTSFASAAKLFRAVRCAPRLRVCRPDGVRLRRVSARRTDRSFAPAESQPRRLTTVEP